MSRKQQYPCRLEQNETNTRKSISRHVSVTDGCNEIPGGQTPQLCREIVTSTGKVVVSVIPWCAVTVYRIRLSLSLSVSSGED